MTNRTDNFNRTDTASAIGTPSDGGSAWSQLSGTWGISTNRGYDSAGGLQEICVLEASVSDADAQVTFTVIGLDYGIVARVSDNNNYLLVQRNPTLYKCVAGSFTAIANGAHTFADGDVVKISVSGSSLSVYINGSLNIGPATDSFNSTATQFGIRSNSSPLTYFDDFSITGSGGATFNPGWASGATRTVGAVF